MGGYCNTYSENKYTPLIARYTIDKWESIGNLQDSRRRHRAIANDDRVYVVGGYPGSSYPT